MRIPMYSVMGGAPVGCSPRIKGGVPGRAIVNFLHFCIMAVEFRFGRAAFFFFSSALCEPYPTQMACISNTANAGFVCRRALERQGRTRLY